MRRAVDLSSVADAQNGERNGNKVESINTLMYESKRCKMLSISNPYAAHRFNMRYNDDAMEWLEEQYNDAVSNLAEQAAAVYSKAESNATEEQYNRMMEQYDNIPVIEFREFDEMFYSDDDIQACYRLSDYIEALESFIEDWSALAW